MLVQAGAYPIEIDQFAVFMLVKMETYRQPGGAEIGIQRDTRVQAGLVEPQLASCVKVFVKVDQEHILQRLIFVYIEALEGLALQFQGLALHLSLALSVGITYYVFQIVGLARQLPLRVELEGIEIVVVPVVDVVFEPDGILFTVGGPYLDLHWFVLTRYIDVKIAADAHRLVTAHAIVYRNFIAAAGTLAVIDAEAEQAMVAHGPELLLLRQPFLLRRCKHMHDRIYLYLIAGDVAVLHFTPSEPRKFTLYLTKVDNVGDIVREIELEVLTPHRQADHKEKIAEKINSLGFHLRFVVVVKV